MITVKFSYALVTRVKGDYLMVFTLSNLRDMEIIKLTSYTSVKIKRPTEALLANAIVFIFR